MALSGGSDRIVLCARLLAVGAAGLVLANCSGSTSRVDPKWGVSASARVVEPGEPVPKGGGVYRVGKPYTVAGRVYVPEENVNYSAVGLASWYGDDFHGRYTANGEIFDMQSITAAHPTLPLPSYVRVTNLSNHRSIVVRVNDRGPFVSNRIIDLSVKTAKLLGFHGNGIAKVKVDYVGRAPLEGSDDRKLVATLREGVPAMPPVMVASAAKSEPPEPSKPQPVRVASAGGYVPTYFDSRPMTQVPAPPDRPYGLGKTAHEVPAVVTQGPAAVRSAPAPRVVAEALPPSVPSVSPVSAYAAPRNDAPAGFMSGRGLY
jgi:rare lipoprotein A